MDFILFLLVALISFIGSVQIGAVSMAVIQTTLSRNLSAGVWVALGGSIPEFIYSFIALKSLFFLQQHQSIIDALNMLIIPVFLLLGLWSFFQKPSDDSEEYGRPLQKNFDFLKGFSLGMINPQLLPFWFFILIFLGKYVSINNLSSKYAFVLGTGMGAFAILFMFAYLAHRYKQYIKGYLRSFSVNRLMGYLFISLAILQVIKVFV